MNYQRYMIGATVLATFIMVASLAETQEIQFQGICDGSAAVRIGNDKILVACDDLNTLFLFKTSGGMYTASIDLGKLGLKIPNPDKEIDIEGAALAENRLWWIGSHGLDNDKLKASNRGILFATNVPVKADLSDMKLEAGPLDLTDDLEKSAEVGKLLEAANQRHPKKGGISIEGLATGANGSLLVGFRSPLSGQSGLDGDAFVVKFVAHGNKFKVEKATLLNLENRGIRAMTNTPNGYMIIAGPPNGNGSCALYNWDGANSPKKTDISLEGLNAEAIVDMGEHWLILSDDGNVKRADQEAKDGDRVCKKILKKNSKHEKHPSVYFRARMIPK